MIVEVLDPSSGAILFKRDKESLTIEELKNKVEILESTVRNLSDEVEKLKSLYGKDSA